MAVLKVGKALYAYREDIERMPLAEELKAHTTGLNPIHRYEGTIELTGDGITLRGRDSWERKEHAERLKRPEITEIGLGFDEAFTRFDDRSLGLTFKPVIIRFQRGGAVRSIYAIVNFRRLSRTTDNGEWHLALREWLASAP